MLKRVVAMAERVLVVEDEPDILDALVQLLARGLQGALGGGRARGPPRVLGGARGGALRPRHAGRDDAQD